MAQLRSTKGVDVSILIYETEDGHQKVSMRSNGVVDVAAIGMKHGGGGHIRATNDKPTNNRSQRQPTKRHLKEYSTFS